MLARLADDLTGSLDTGVAFAARGWRTVVRMAERGDRSDPSAGSGGPAAPRLRRQRRPLRRAIIRQGTGPVGLIADFRGRENNPDSTVFCVQALTPPSEAEM